MLHNNWNPSLVRDVTFPVYLCLLCEFVNVYVWYLCAGVGGAHITHSAATRWTVPLWTVNVTTFEPPAVYVVTCVCVSAV